MTRSPAKLQVLGAVDSTEGDATNPVVPVAGVGADDGRLAHRALHGRSQEFVSGQHATEAEVLGFACDLLEAPEETTGMIAAGVTEAALLLMRGARDAAPLVARPTVVLPQSAHPAYFAAAATVGLNVRPIPLDADGRVSLGALVSALDEHVVLTVASAPSFTHGTADPIAWIAAATSARGVRLHVDATSGGWALAYAQREGRVGTAWSFTVYGVDSIALDLGPDRGGTPDLTALLYRDNQMHRAVRVAAMTSGPLPVPAAWQPAHRVLADVALATRELGHEGCAEIALEAVAAAARIAQEISGIPGLPGVHVVAPPEATSFTLRTDLTCDAFTLTDALYRRGWSAQPVLVEVGPPLVRIPVTAAMYERMDLFWTALVESVSDARERGRAQLDATLQRLLERLDPHDVDEYATQLLLDTASVLDDADHVDEDRRAQVNLLLATASPGVREAILSAYLDRLGRPVRAQP